MLLNKVHVTTEAAVSSEQVDGVFCVDFRANKFFVNVVFFASLENALFDKQQSDFCLSHFFDIV